MKRLIWLMLVACSPTTVPTTVAVTSAPATTAPVTTVIPTITTDVSAAAAIDLRSLLTSLETIHPEPFHGVEREAFVAEMERLLSNFEQLTPEEAMVEVMRLWATLSAQGQDGHQFALPLPGEEGPMLPLRIFEFRDGLFVTAAINQDLVGAEIVGVAGRPIEEVLATLEPLVPRDSPATVPFFRPRFLLRVDVLEGLGLIEDDSKVPLTLSGPGAGAREVVVATVPFDHYQDFAGVFGDIQLPERAGFRFLTQVANPLTVESLGSVAYAHLDLVETPSSAALDELADLVADPTTESVVIDLRHNPGGDNGTYTTLLEISQSVDGPLYVLIDRGTFSAAANLATEIEQSTNARFVGEAMGGALNFWDDVSLVPLRHLPIPMQVGVSTRYWAKSVPDETRLTIEPELAIPYTSADFFAGIDRALDVVLSQ